MIGARSRSTRCTAPSSSLSVRVQSSSTSATATSSATAKVRSRSENRSPPPSASEPTAAPATTRGSLSARARTRSRNASRCATVNIDKQDDGMTADLTTLLSSLVAADSVNPSLVVGGAGENEIAGLIEGWARDAGLETERVEETPGRPSVLVRARGVGEGRTLLLCGHIDTVNVEGMADAHTPRIDGDRLYGRGAYDMKAGVAAALIAAREASRMGLAGDVVVAAVADEEHASLGVQEALRHVSADAAVVTEPTELELAVAHKGFVWSEIEVTGRAAHGSRPHLGVDAILKMGAVLAGLEELDRELAHRTHPMLGRGSLHASLIQGGVELSSYPAQCTLSVE